MSKGHLVVLKVLLLLAGERRCIYVHRQRVVGSGGVFQKCERKSWKELQLLLVPARGGV